MSRPPKAEAQLTNSRLQQQGPGTRKKQLRFAEPAGPAASAAAGLGRLRPILRRRREAAMVQEPVVYTVDYKDVVRRGRKAVDGGRRRRRYSYWADADYVRRDWERTVDAHVAAAPAVCNRSVVRGKEEKPIRIKSFLDKKNGIILVCKILTS